MVAVSQTDTKWRIALASAAMSSLRRIWSDRYLCLPTKVRVYQTPVLPSLKYASETWTLLAADIKKAVSLPYEMPTPNRQDPSAGPCAEHRRFLSDRFRSCAGLLNSIARRRSSLFGHCSQTSRGHTWPPSLAVPHICHRSVIPDPSWRRCPGRPRYRWFDQLPQRKQYTSCWPRESSRHAWTLGGDAAVLHDYALTTNE